MNILKIDVVLNVTIFKKKQLEGEPKTIYIWSWSQKNKPFVKINSENKVLVGYFHLDELILWSNYNDSTKRQHLLTSIQSFYDRQLTMRTFHWNLFDFLLIEWLQSYSINVDQKILSNKKIHTQTSHTN